MAYRMGGGGLDEEGDEEHPVVAHPVGDHREGDPHHHHQYGLDGEDEPHLDERGTHLQDVEGEDGLGDVPGEIEQEGGQEYDIRAPGEAAVLLQKLDQLDLLPVVLGRLINVFTYREPEHIEVSNNRVYTKRFLAEMGGAVHMSPLKNSKPSQSPRRHTPASYANVRCRGLTVVEFAQRFGRQRHACVCSLEPQGTRAL